MSYVKATPFTQDGSSLEPLADVEMLNPLGNQGRARNSSVECRPHTTEVEGSTPSAPTTCLVENCDNPRQVRGMCRPHYLKAYRRGLLPTPLQAYRVGDDLLALTIEVGRERTRRAAECLIWPFRRQSRGYAVIHGRGNADLVSRLICEAIHGPAPEGHPLALHNCDNGAGGCIEPTHIEWGSYRKNNVEDRIRAGTFAPWGRRRG